MLSPIELRRSAAELLAFAVLDIFPGVTLVGGKVTEFGFYYDFVAEQPIDANAIHFIEEKVRGLVKEAKPVRAIEMMRENAAAFFEHRDQPFRAEAISCARDNIVTLFQLDEFHDYCQPSYISDTSQIAAFKVQKIERAKHNLPEEGLIDVVRIRGVVFPEKDQLKKHLKSVQAAKKCDHRAIGDQMHFFKQMDELSSLSMVWTNNGASFREVLYDFWRHELRKQRFNFLVTPFLVKESLVKTSGLYEHELEAIDDTVCSMSEVDYVIPPSLAQSHAIVYRAKSRSYSELPLRFAECAELSLATEEGDLWGALTNRLVYCDQAHIFCAPAQVERELISSLQFIDRMIKIFGFEYHWYLQGSGQKMAGTHNQWERANESFVKAFESAGLAYTISENETCYSGPMAEACLIDRMGREWKGPQVGVDFNSPHRFGLRYLGSDGKMHQPVMLKRTLFGSFERFTAILIEHYAGQFPVWLAPEQVRVIPVLEKNNSYADQVCKAIEERGYRTKIDLCHEQLGHKIHSADEEKVPYLIVLGDKEEKQGLITVRLRGQKTAGEVTTIDAFLAQLCDEVQSKMLPQKSKNAK